MKHFQQFLSDYMNLLQVMSHKVSILLLNENSILVGFEFVQSKRNQNEV